MLVPWKSVKKLMEKALRFWFLPFCRQKQITATAIAAPFCTADLSLAKHRTVFPQAVFGVAEIHLYFSSGHLPAMCIKEQVVILSAHRAIILTRANLSLFNRRICKGATQNGLVQNTEKGSCPSFCYSCHRHPKQVSEEQQSSLGGNGTPWQMKKMC